MHGLHGWGWGWGKTEKLADLLLTKVALVPLVASCRVLISVEPIGELPRAVGTLKVIHAGTTHAIWDTPTSTGHSGPPFQPVSSTGLPINSSSAKDFEYKFWIWKSASKKFWRAKILDPPAPPSLIGSMHIPLDSSQRQDSQYLILVRIDTWCPKVLRTAPSWNNVQDYCPFGGAEEWKTDTSLKTTETSWCAILRVYKTH